MERTQEMYARELYQELQERFGTGTVLPSILRRLLGITSVTLKGEGMVWCCTVRKGKRLCKIDLVNRTGIIGHITFFKEDGKVLACGNSIDKARIITAVEDWLSRHSIEQLYTRYDFIDRRKKDLTGILDRLLTQYPLFDNQVQAQVVRTVYDSYALFIDNALRGCVIYYPDIFNESTYPTYVFNWDAATMFETSGAVDDRIGTLIKQWVCDNAMPSKLQLEFPEINFTKLAAYYEQGNRVVREFMASWDSIEQFYREMNENIVPDILRLIEIMRDESFARTLRAGTSLYSFILSRSLKYGLRPDQPFVCFEFHYIKPAAMKVSCFRQDGTKEVLSFDSIEYNEAIARMLKELEQVELS